MKKVTFLSIIYFLLLFGSSCNSPSQQDIASSKNTYTKNTIAYKTVANVDANLLSLDIYHFGQNNALKPIVIYVHGGGFSVGDKANSISNKVALFESLNYIFVSLNYRLSPTQLSTDPNRVMYPTHNNDVADAVKWVYDNAATYGGDKTKIVLMGHSAGAHLVSLTGTSNLFLPAKGIMLSSIKGIASIDTEGYDVAQQAKEGEAVYLNAFGTSPTIWAEASPINHLFVGTNYPKFFVAKRGSNVRIGLADSFIAKLQSVGVDVSQVTANQYDHEGINDAIGAPGETAVTEPLKQFLAKCFQ